MEEGFRGKYRDKVRHIIPTFLAILVGSIVGLIFVRWLLSVKFDLVEIKEQVWNMWIPMFFPWIPITLWLRHRLKILVREDTADKYQLRLQFLAWIVLAIPSIISQFYFTTAAGDLVHLDTVADLTADPDARYYTIKHFDVIPPLGGSAETIEAKGRDDENLDFNIFFVTPITKDSVEAPATHNCWYSVKYSLEISNRISQVEKDKKYDTFYHESVAKINAFNYHDVNYFRRLPPSEDKDGFIKAINGIYPSLAEHAVILEASQEDFEERNGSLLLWLIGAAVAGVLVFLLALRFF